MFSCEYTTENMFIINNSNNLHRALYTYTALVRTTRTSLFSTPRGTDHSLHWSWSPRLNKVDVNYLHLIMDILSNFSPPVIFLGPFHLPTTGWCSKYLNPFLFNFHIYQSVVIYQLMCLSLSNSEFLLIFIWKKRYIKIKICMRFNTFIFAFEISVWYLFMTPHLPVKH